MNTSGQKYPAGNSYAIPTDYTVVAAAARSSRKSAAAVASPLTSLSTDQFGAAPSADELILLNNKLHNLLTWANDQVRRIDHLSRQDTNLRAVFARMASHYQQSIDELPTARFPRMQVEVIYEGHANCCRSVQKYLRKYRIKGLALQPLSLN